MTWLLRLTQKRKINDSEVAFGHVGQRWLVARQAAALVRWVGLIDLSPFLLHRGPAAWHVLAVERLVEVLTDICEVVSIHALLIVKVGSVEKLLLSLQRLVSRLLLLQILLKFVVLAFADDRTGSYGVRFAWVAVVCWNPVGALAHDFHAALLVKQPLHRKDVDLEVWNFLVEINDLSGKLCIFLSGGQKLGLQIGHCLLVFQDSRVEGVNLKLKLLVLSQEMRRHLLDLYRLVRNLFWCGRLWLMLEVIEAVRHALQKRGLLGDHRVLLRQRIRVLVLLPF
jgi:hypothetical protein